MAVTMSLRIIKYQRSYSITIVLSLSKYRRGNVIILSISRDKEKLISMEAFQQEYYTIDYRIKRILGTLNVLYSIDNCVTVSTYIYQSTCVFLLQSSLCS